MPEHPAPKKPIWIGVCMSLPFIGSGLFFALSGFGILRLGPGAHAPDWLIGMIGLAFFGAGSLLLISSLAGASSRDGSLPRTAPFWLRAASAFIGTGVVLALAVTATWVALNPDPQNTRETITVFGVERISEAASGSEWAFRIGAGVTWCLALFLIMRVWRNLRAPTKQTGLEQKG